MRLSCEIYCFTSVLFDQCSCAVELNKQPSTCEQFVTTVKLGLKKKLYLDHWMKKK